MVSHTHRGITIGTSPHSLPVCLGFGRRKRMREEKMDPEDEKIKMIEKNVAGKMKEELGLEP